MAYVKELDQMDPAVPPPPCRLDPRLDAALPEFQAHEMAKGFMQQVYAAVDAGAAAQLPFRPDTVFCFQKGEADRFQGQALLPRLQQLHKVQARDLGGAAASGLTTQVFPGNSVLVLATGDFNTEASVAKSQREGYQLKHRFADFFMIGNDQGGPHLKCGVMREIDEDIGAPPAGKATGELFMKADQVTQKFMPFFYQQLDDQSKRAGLNSLFKDMSYLTVGTDLFKGQRHIAHKMHYLPPLARPRTVAGCDAIPSPAGGFFVYAHGTMLLAGQEHEVPFVDVFHLMPEGSSFWVSNGFMKVL
eukprot:TRINITY_DN30040_c0_g1_i1.p1 TRINITY_DN30040_c0_g1~~TRINITY_DN30040_c0_g1_i1.p1  ORF type:complete len:303 (+),score=137.17 TRINITY_DN30040_c0_g1_i1:47-955(+)